MKAPDMAGAMTLTDCANAPGKEMASCRNRFSSRAGDAPAPTGVRVCSAVSFIGPPLLTSSGASVDRGGCPGDHSTITGRLRSDPWLAAADAYAGGTPDGAR